jgi:hypothetical protein
VAEEMAIDVAKANTRYSTIRTKFSKYLLKLKLRSGSGATAVLEPQFEHLRWLVCHIDQR